MYHLIVPLVGGPDNTDVAWIEEALCKRFGGFTRQDGQGGWVAPDGKVVKEPVACYGAARIARIINHEQLMRDKQLIAALAEQVGLLFNQDAVFYGASPFEAHLWTRS